MCGLIVYGLKRDYHSLVAKAPSVCWFACAGWFCSYRSFVSFLVQSAGAPTATPSWPRSPLVGGGTWLVRCYPHLYSMPHVPTPAGERLVRLVF